MKKLLLLFTLIIGLSVLNSSAQGPPPPPPPPGPPPPGTGAPIDTDVALLLFVAAAFGVYKLKKANVKTLPLS